MSGYSGPGVLWSNDAFGLGFYNTIKGCSISDLSETNQGTLLGTNVPAGRVYYVKVFVPSVVTVSAIDVFLTAAGVTLTAGQNFVGIYQNVPGSTNQLQLLASSVDQAANWVGAIQFQTATLAAPITLNPGYYYVGFLWNGTTSPTFLGRFGVIDRAVQNYGITNMNNFRLVLGNEVGQTVLPATSVVGTGGNTNYLAILK